MSKVAQNIKFYLNRMISHGGRRLRLTLGNTKRTTLHATNAHKKETITGLDCKKNQSKKINTRLHTILNIT